MLPRGYIQTDDEMDESNLVIATTSKIYSRDSDNSEKISAIVGNIADDLSKMPQMIEFANTELVKSVVVRYIKSCERAGVVPMISGLARACGCDRSTFSKYIQRHPGHPTAIYLKMVTEAFSETITQASLAGAVQPIVSIFTQKTDYGKRENEPIVEPKEDLLGDVVATDDLDRKYAEMED